MKTYHVHLRGRVQGVGFRPFVFRLAQEMALRGTVSNGADGVHIHLQASGDVAAEFVRRAQAEAPAMALVTAATVEALDQPRYAGFAIVESTDSEQTALWLTPDLALCDACRAELHDPANRRFGYAFITCTDCGPRYSIARALPFDRAVTTMAGFAMCAACAAEYESPNDRRFYAQTNSCPACGVSLRGWIGDEAMPPGRELAETDAQLRAGRIVAVKGIGGFLLLCDATSAAAVHCLRLRKHRPSKPFAVLYPDVETLRGDCNLHPDELTELRGPAAPIVLLAVRAQPASGIALGEVAPRLAQLGVMLPYAPLLALLARRFGRPLVATSGNVSGSPMVYQDNEARAALGEIADAFLSHDRAIVVPQDDSVVRFSARHRRRIVLRRGRGLAPAVPPASGEMGRVRGGGNADLAADAPANVLAFGASLKSTFAWSVNGYEYVSQYLGDLESFDTQEQFRAALTHFRRLLRQAPAQVLADAHPSYFSTQLAAELAADWQVPLYLVQHHTAHLAAVLAEHPASPEPTLGIIWDGTGYGPDGQVWGGEFLLAPGATTMKQAARQAAPAAAAKAAQIPYSPAVAEVPRLTHFAYFDALLGDKMPREPRLSAFSIGRHLRGGAAVLPGKFTAQEYDLYTKLLAGNTLKTSSVGRVFDAVAAILDLGDVVSYEGEAALRLETLAAAHLAQPGPAAGPPYLADWDGRGPVPTYALLQAVLNDHQAGQPAGLVAARFHRSLVGIIRKVADAHELKRLAFSGGVFQNALLVDLIMDELAADYTLLFHEQLAPNDENISLGQLAAANWQMSQVAERLGPRN